MTDLRGTYAPDSESDYTGNTMFKIVAAIILLLGLGAVGAYYLGTEMLQHQPTRVALATPSAVKPVIAPRMTVPAPIQSAVVPSAAQPASTDTASALPPRVRKHVAQQSADLQPHPAALEAPSTSTPTPTPPAVTPTPPAVDTNAPTQDPAAAQPATQQ